MTKKMKKNLQNIIISFIFLFLAFITKEKIQIISAILFIISYLIVGLPVLHKALKNIKRRKIFDENFLMTIATLGAIAIGELPEAVAVMLFYQIGELFQSLAVDKSRKSVKELMNIRPDYANVEREGNLQKVAPENVKIAEIIIIKPGEKIPLDGIIIEGESSLNTVALTGESMPTNVKQGDEVLSGCVNNTGLLKVKVMKEFGESTVSKILELVENASSRKSKSEAFISKFAKYYTPIVVIIALIIAIIPPIIFSQSFITWIYRALTFLVVSCPCALVISIPLSFFGGIGASSKIGVLVKGSNYLEALSNIEIIVCDKTGTLTEGKFKVQNISPTGVTEKELLKLASYAENYSTHPIALSIKEEYGEKIDPKKISDVKEISGKGVKATINGEEILVGNAKLMKEYKINLPENNKNQIYVSRNNNYIGSIEVSDKIKEDSYKTVKELKKHNVKKIVMLTGDKDEVSKEVSEKLGLDEYHSELLPQDKVKIVEDLMKNKSEKSKLLFVGDGINDAPVLALSDIGVAMGGLGSDAAIEAADIVIMTDEPSKIAEAINVSKRTMKIVKENIIFALTVKVLVLILASLGIATMWAAVFADVGVSVLAILNALRILKTESK